MSEKLFGKTAEKREIGEDMGPINDIMAPFRTEGQIFCSEMRQTYEFLRETLA